MTQTILLVVAAAIHSKVASKVNIIGPSEFFTKTIAICSLPFDCSFGAFQVTTMMWEVFMARIRCSLPVLKVIIALRGTGLISDLGIM